MISYWNHLSICDAVYCGPLALRIGVRLKIVPVPLCSNDGTCYSLHFSRVVTKHNKHHAADDPQ